jgi:hypothetical protein
MADTIEDDEAWDFFVSEAARQHSLSVEVVNSSMQRVGIILAFTPLLLIEAVKYISEDSSWLDYLPAIVLGICFFTGVLMIIEWKISMPSPGVDLQNLLEVYRKEGWSSLKGKVLIDAMQEQVKINEKIDTLRKWIFVMVSTLLFGVVWLACAIMSIELSGVGILLLSISAGLVIGYFTYYLMKNKRKRKGIKDAFSDWKEP